jgi:hypothetical protein
MKAPVARQAEVTMTRVFKRSLLIAAAILMVALPVELAAGDQTETPNRDDDAAPQVPYAMQTVPCGKRTDVVKMLRDNFGETSIARGLADTGAVAEVFISANGSWTIVATSPNGVSCMVGSGEKWQPIVARDGTI